MTKHDRWQLIEQALLKHPEGLRQIDLVKRLGSNRSTICRDILAMSTLYPIEEDDNRRLKISRTGYLSEVRLTMHELEALHLSARLFIKVMRFPFPYASGALRKLAEAQERVSRALASRIRDTAEEIDSFISESGMESYSKYIHIIEDLGLAISEARPVRISYYSRRRNKCSDYRVAPVTLEPYPEGMAVYLIAWDLSQEKNFFRTFKTERIKEMVLEDSSPDLYRNIPVKNLAAHFRDAWGIWRSDDSPITVRLLFSVNVADRVEETLWHTRQTVRRLDDGRLEWQANIAEPQEMYPWIRGWGPDVEVLEPSWLREKHLNDFRKGLSNYGQQDTV